MSQDTARHQQVNIGEHEEVSNAKRVLQVDADGNPVSPSAGGDGVILDGTNASIKATVKDLSNSNPLTVAIVDGSGDQISSFGGGTQYTEGDTDATITGTAALVEGAANALVPMTQPLTDTELRAADVKVTLDGETVPVTGTFFQATQPVSAASLPLPTGAATAANQQTDALTDAELRATPVPVSGSFYPATQPVSATDLDIRNLSSATDSVTIVPSGTQTVSGTVTANLAAGTNNIGDVDVLTLPTDVRSATAVDATASGDTTIVSITNSPRLYYVSLSANGANSADVTVIVRIGASAKYKVSLKAGAIWARNIGAGRNYITGSTGDDIIVNLSAAQTVHVSVEYADV